MHFHRKDAKDAKKSRKIDGKTSNVKNPLALPISAIHVSKDMNGFFSVVRFSFTSFASLR
jgi:hypothetical protein